MTNEMRDGGLVEVASRGIEGMLGIGVCLGDRSAVGRKFQEVAMVLVPSMTIRRFVKESVTIPCRCRPIFPEIAIPRSIPQHDAQQRIVDLQTTVVLDEAEFPELVHEKVYPRACRSDHLSQRFLRHSR